MALDTGRRTVQVEVRFARDGVELGTLEAVGAPEISMTTDAESKLALSGTFRKSALLNPLRDRVRPYLLLNGVRYPLGDYVITAAPEEYTRGVERVRLECMDAGIILKESRTEEHIMFAKNNRYTDIIQAILIQNGISSILCEEAEARLQTDREDWEVGTPYLTIVNALLAEINYNSLWFDFDGFARVERYRAPHADSLRQSHIYRSGAASILKADCRTENDLLCKPNVFLATVSNPDYPEPLRARAVNDDAGSPISTVSRGRALVAVYKLDNIASQAELQDFVENEKYKSLLATQTIVVETALNPVHLVGDTFALQHELLSGIFTETQWRMTLAPGGVMTHTGRRVLYVD